MFINTNFNRKSNKFQLKGKTLHLEALEDRTLLSASPLNMDSSDFVPAMVAPAQASEILAPDISVVADLGETNQQSPETSPVALNASYNSHDVSCLRSFLEQTDENGVKNGVKLNSNYNSQNYSTWTGVTWAEVNGSMRVTEIDWAEKSLVGSLNVSSCTALTKLNCFDNQITELNVSQCSALTWLNCGDNRLTSLDVSTNKALTWLRCGNYDYNDNQIASLDVSKNTALTYLNCMNIEPLTSVDVSKNTELTYLDVSFLELDSIDVSNNIKLTDFSCRCTGITSLDVSKNTALEYLDCGWNNLTSLDVSKNTALKDLDCFDNQLTSLDVSKNSALKELVCFENQLTSLDVSKNTALEILHSSHNQLISLDVSKNTKLTDFSCSYNQLTALDVTSCPLLENLWCYDNQLTEIDLSNNTALHFMNCGANPLITLDLSNNTALAELECPYLQLTTLDVSNNTELVELLCWNSNLNTVILPSERSADTALCLSCGSEIEWTFKDAYGDELESCGQSYDGGVIYSCGLLATTTSLPVYATSASGGQTVVFTDSTLSEVNARVVFRDSLTNVDSSATLPSGVSSVRAGQTVYAEIWLKGVDSTDPAITGAYMNMLYNSASLTVQDVAYGSVFSVQTGFQTYENNAISTIGGVVPFGVMDTGDNEWVRLATVSFVADTAGSTTVALSAPNDLHDNVTRTDGTILSPWEINFGSASLTIRPACPMDIDGDGYIGISDYSLMSKAWRTAPGNANWNPACDIDGDSYVGMSDYTFLSKNWRKYTTDPSIVYPPSNAAGAASVPCLSDDSSVEQIAQAPAPVQQVNNGEPSSASAIIDNSEESTTANALILVSESKSESSMTLREAYSAALLDLFDSQDSSDLQSASAVLADTRLELPAAANSDNDSPQTSNDVIAAFLEDDPLAIDWE